MITNLFILICVGVWIYINFISKEDKTITAMKLGAMYSDAIDNRHEYWRFITCNFIHVEFIHLFMNVYCIYFLGHMFESILGTPLYLGFMFFTMIVGGFIIYASSFYFDHAKIAITLGASGIFYGYLGAMIGLALFAGGYFTMILHSYAYAIIINLAFTLMSPHVSKAGHLGGLLGGYFYIFVLYLTGIVR